MSQKYYLFSNAINFKSLKLNYSRPLIKNHIMLIFQRLADIKLSKLCVLM